MTNLALNVFLVSPRSMCDSGKWRCSENFCPARCLIEGQFVTSFDGKQYVVPGKCTYVASQVNFSPTSPTFNLFYMYDSNCPFKQFPRVLTGQ